LSNLTFTCASHHLAGEHGGKVTIWGRAPDDLYFQAGRKIWKNERLVRQFATVGEARAWARRQKRDIENNSGRTR